MRSWLTSPAECGFPRLCRKTVIYAIAKGKDQHWSGERRKKCPEAATVLEFPQNLSSYLRACVQSPIAGLATTPRSAASPAITNGPVPAHRSR